MSKIEILNEDDGVEDDSFQARAYDFYSAFMANAERPWKVVFSSKDSDGNPNESWAHTTYKRVSGAAHVGYRFCMGSTWFLGTTVLLVAVPVVYGMWVARLLCPGADRAFVLDSSLSLLSLSFRQTHSSSSFPSSPRFFPCSNMHSTQLEMMRAQEPAAAGAGGGGVGAGGAPAAEKPMYTPA